MRFCVAAGLFGTLAWISARHRNLFPALLLVVVTPVGWELLSDPATRPATLAFAFRFVPAVAAFLGAGLLGRGRRNGRWCRAAALAGFLALAFTAGSAASGPLLGAPFRLEWQPAVAGLAQGGLSALLFEAVGFLASRPGPR